MIDWRNLEEDLTSLHGASFKFDVELCELVRISFSFFRKKKKTYTIGAGFPIPVVILVRDGNSVSPNALVDVSRLGLKMETNV